MTTWSEDLWDTSTSALLRSLRALGTKEVADKKTIQILNGALLADGMDLTSAGQELYKSAFVQRDQQRSKQILADAIRGAFVIQVIEQELQGYGPVTDEGIFDLLRLHGAVPSGKTLVDLRRLLNWMNELGLIAYSKRLKTVRSLRPAPEAASIGEDRRLSAIISPRTPMLNVVRLRQVIRSITGTLWWIDPHFSRRCLEDLIEEIDFTRVGEIRILSGNDAQVLGDKPKSDFRRFQAEVDMKGGKAFWFADSMRDWHDRYLIGDTVEYNVPPANTLYKGDYTEIRPAVARPPAQEWWARSDPAW
ncbi:hypothetical protein DMH04_14505 [Kibdelosporangium aridum]|uniref:Uncharacterized protein n=1 Tax=Kibdelosporangium aridum TaxID=2030 RepID=A0A428ZE91_KIBAR|nr:hypothetical protein [Kibdelosporangium aridum]RSM86366.1 hypothetical protein DMH04_14505 [Kibdelosporangium aridum]